ncbi:MAG: tRNA uridine-5-carboxymethylaminomethyl(34) synthesis GTPase MnmE [Spirochaetia bacterium]|nr:tRNA uridine-5-carboxymethylaminomethyl(34) synthesis GTPase MnmE [Spirochaetia bacterium]
MQRSYFDTKSPIMALATPPGRSALAVIRLSGENTIALFSKCFSYPEKIQNASGYTLHYGYFLEPKSGEKIDEIMVAVFRKPHSFTGDDSIELSCHGSPAVINRILSILELLGCKPALPGEFSFRSFINGKRDLVETEAINELTGARSETARSDALLRLTGILSQYFSELRKQMLDLLAEIEARLDYPEDEGPDLEIQWIERLHQYSKELQSVSKGYIGGRLRQEGALIVLAGRPNAGKSSLFNLLVREERAIVSPEPGTTRDWIETWLEIAGYPVRLVDTAGLRPTQAVIEAEGVRRSIELIHRSDIVLYIVDGEVGLLEEDLQFLQQFPSALKLWNKTDSLRCKDIPEGWIGITTKALSTAPTLEKAIFFLLEKISNPTSLEISEMRSDLADYQNEKHQKPRENAVAIAEERQKMLVDACYESIEHAIFDLKQGSALDIIALDIREAANYLGEITGELVNEEVFDRIFSKFCLGK